MALALDQGVQWDYLPPICTRIKLSQDIDKLICTEELMSFITRLQQHDNVAFLNHPNIASSLHSGTILHFVLCGATCRSCSKEFPIKGSHISSIEGHSQFPNAPSLPQQLRRMQAPRLPIFVFMLTMLMDIKSRTEGCLIGQSVTLAEFFAVLETAMYDNHFDQYPHGLENVLMVIIHGFDVSLVPCSDPGVCTLHGELAQERFPRWPLVFSVMKVMGAVRRLSAATRKRLETVLRGMVVVPRRASTLSTEYFEKEHDSPGMLDPSLEGLKGEVCQQLSL